MNGFAFVIAVAFFVGGLLLMGYSFYMPGWEAAAFIGGVLATAFAVAIPVHVLKRVDR
ncbi:MAG TPA: hypothetical protein PK781_03855 [Terrimesophilobacter sp.]|nr:hypothetical protein [Terrimesophilobacter sp.]HRP99577.1 hypothetical protein [Terrimesophilobacter sp.]